MQPGSLPPYPSFASAPTREPSRQRPLPPRRGLLARYVALTTPPGSPDDASLPLPVRERLRRAQLASAIFGGMFLLDLLLIPATTDQISSLAAVLVVLVTCVVAALLNRQGWVTAAGYLVVLVLVAAVAAIFLTAPVVTLDYVPVYDLLTIPLLVAASVLPRGQIFLIAVLNSAFIVADSTLQPHAHQMDISTPDGLSLVLRPVILQIILAIVSFLWARSMDRALARADRAEEIAALEHEVAEQKRQLDIGIRQILDTHIRAANGDFSARAPVAQGNALWQIGSSLNNLLSRVQRASTSEYQLRRTEDAIDRLAVALRDARAGRLPMWPAPDGTRVDTLIETIVDRRRQAPPLQSPQSDIGY
jgi:hypothetical protein